MHSGKIQKQSSGHETYKNLIKLVHIAKKIVKKPINLQITKCTSIFQKPCKFTKNFWKDTANIKIHKENITRISKNK